MMLLVIGLGNMAGALLRGMAASGRYEMKDIAGYDVDLQKAEALSREAGFQLADSLPDAVRRAERVLLAVKPQVLPDVLAAHGQAMKGKLVISIAAGRPLRFYEGHLGEGAAVVRVMPSVNALVSEAASALCWTESVTEDQRLWAARMMQSVGTVSEISEALFPAFSALASAAPAFVFQMLDALASAGVKAGLSRDVAIRTASQMALGSARLLIQSGRHPRQMMDMVTSPGGTTIEGVHALDRLGFDHAIHEAVAAVVEKDIRLGRGSTSG